MVPATEAMTATATLDPNYAPRPPLETGLVVVAALLFVLTISVVATAIGRCRRRANPPYVRRRAPAPCMVDIEQARTTIGTDNGINNGTDNGKNGSRILAFPPLAVLARSWSSSTTGSGSSAFGKLAMELPPPALAVAPSSRLRDSVLCKALGQLNWPAPGDDKNTQKNSRRIVDIEAAAADKVIQPRNTNHLHADASLSYPKWVLPHLAEIRDQSQRQWTIYTPPPPIVPEIVIQSCDNEPVPDSPASTYSTDSDSAPSEIDTPPPMTPTLASPVSFYFPASPTFSEREYLQVPPPSFNAPREEEKPVMRNVSNFSGKTFALATPPGRFSKMGKLRERRMLAQAQAAATITTVVDEHKQTSATQNVAQVVKGCGTGPRISQRFVSTVGFAQPKGPRVTGLGLGLQLLPQLDFEGSLDKALAAACPSGDEAAPGTSGTFSTAAYLALDGNLEAATTTDVTLAAPTASEDDSKVFFDTDVYANEDAHTNADAYAINAYTSNDAHNKDDAPADACLNVVVSAPAGGDNSGKGRPERLARPIDAFDSSFSLASINSDGGQGTLRSIMDDYHYDDEEETFEYADANSPAITELVVHENQARRAVVVVCAI